MNSTNNRSRFVSSEKKAVVFFCSERSRIGYQAKTISINTFFLFFCSLRIALMVEMEKEMGKKGNEKVLKRPMTKKQQKAKACSNHKP